MRIFGSWSGTLSSKFAMLFRDEIVPTAFNNSELWVSSEDISKGAFWSEYLNEEIHSSDAAIVFLTRENFMRPWINFEAGAFAHRFRRA